MNDSIRWVDYRVDIGKKKYLLEAKALNVDLYDKSPDGAVNQIRRTFKMADVKEKYEGGIATDGRIWVFLDKDGNDRQKLDAQKDYDKIVKILNGDQTIRRDIRQEDISKKFYKQYREIVNGGGNIALEDCLTNSITNVVDDDRKEIAQRIINRLIFIKMLQSRNIIKNDVINYVANIEPEFRNFKLNQLFFDVMNVQSDKRDFSIDSEFRDIPYLNGGLFNKSDAELRNADYYVKPDIIKSIALFLDSFRYTDEWEEDSDSLDPEILGYIFEMAMAEEERSSTGSFYTPKEITEFMAEQAILDQIVRKINRLIISEYRNIKPIEKYNDLFSKERMGPHQNSEDSTHSFVF